MFLCFDYKNEIPLAIKTFKDEYLPDQNAIERLKWEAETWIRLEQHSGAPHLNIYLISRR